MKHQGLHSLSVLIDLQVISIMILGIHESSSVLDSNNLAQDTCLMLVWLFTVRIGLLYVISGLGGSIMSGLFIQSSISVGASGALFGLLGGMLSELLTNWTLYASKVFIELLLFEICTSEVIVTFWSETLLGPIILQFFFFFEPVCSIINPRGHHCNQLGSGNPPTCGQLCSYWRICFGFSSRVCVSDTPPIWMG